jgi:hypothetical protein
VVGFYQAVAWAALWRSEADPCRRIWVVAVDAGIIGKMCERFSTGWVSRYFEPDSRMCSRWITACECNHKTQSGK